MTPSYKNNIVERKEDMYFLLEYNPIVLYILLWPTITVEAFLEEVLSNFFSYYLKCLWEMQLY